MTRISESMPRPSTPPGDIVDVIRSCAADHDHEQQQRECHDELGQARDPCVDPAAEVRARAAEEDSQRERQDGRADGDGERGPAADQEAQELVPAEWAVGSEHEQRIRGAAGRWQRHVGCRVCSGDVDGWDLGPRADGFEAAVDGVGEEVVRAVAEQGLCDLGAGQEREDDEGDRPC
jgi:hypothetical protein